MESKSKIRKRILNVRNNMSKEDVKKNSNAIMDKITSLDIYKHSKVVFIYMDFKNEVMTSNLIKRMLSEKKRVVIPYTDSINTVLIPSEITKESDLKQNSFGYFEPKSILPVNIEEIDLVIVPGVVFDKNLNRIGFGKGYYDKILNRLKPSAKKVALAHDFQVLEDIPAEEHDVKMDMIITEKNIYPFTGLL
ncbi:MAG TPA: 5-formyltetrahydrofolate cyclo-ligase [Sedimentibacter sp.]|jgi:5-formyltetrahydrofolate cyclo-ligase|nr:5-formyltetrahydrofolate cyclo-ligase [Sedimentibacter sp.]HOA19492.1 5-formyltetrahydrofolate cyclo-ligase [Sedimentibacter sp.]HOG62469.1 5-formyltetrahydrofolate cyclo-ligase [Sedimentibacter sp.]HPV85404.1 5-formyltetrahydrofolate cyclo-ligase [Sedimentibacter sp.]HQK52775.1 5-formyltetrahydrofolate cyclo-ligase [Sedimentibacter sp.]